MVDLKELSKKYHYDLAAKALELELLREHKFVEDVGEILVEAAEI